MRRLIIEDDAQNTRDIFDVDVIGGLMLTYTQEKCLEDNMSYYDQVNGAVVVEWNAVLLASEFKSPEIKHNNGYTVDDLMKNYA